MFFHRLYTLRIVRHFSSSKNRVRVRFAPSPTGHLHLGGLRTALYNYLFARANKGTFILRIEDTDQSRLVEGATELLQKDLIWAGIEIDEGPTSGGNFGPYIQSRRLYIYKEQVKLLLEKGAAYHCFCSENRLELLRKDAVRRRQVPKYDNRCRHLSDEDVKVRLERGDYSCIRFKLNSGPETFNDLIYGGITYDVSLNEGDPVIIKSDGFPTYHFANVVDDHLMEISHVLRGTEWQISTTKHILMYKAFGWESPVFGHLPLLLNADGTKLSKRQGDIKIEHYRETGVFPLALINFIINSGGGFEKDLQRGLKPKVYTMTELAEQFDVEKLNSHSGKLVPERLKEFNRLELARRLEDPKETNGLVKDIQNMVQRKFGGKFSTTMLQLDENYIKTTLNWAIARIHNLDDLFSNDLAFVWVMPNNTEKLDDLQTKSVKLFVKNFSSKEVSSKEEISKFLKEFSLENNIQYGPFMKSLRTILSGLKEGPKVADMMEILGKTDTLRRLENYINNREMR